MRIAIICNDTRGGVQPYVALGRGLARAGYDVRAVAPAALAWLFTAAQLPVAPLSEGEGGTLQASTAIAERGTIATMRFMARTSPALTQAWTRETLAACAGVDLLTGGVGGMVIGLSVAEKLGVPFVPTHLQPVGAPTGDYAGVLLARMPRLLGRPGRRLSHTLSEAALWMPFRGAMMTARREVLGLTGRPRAADGQPVLYGFSRAVVDVPPGEPARHVTGYWTGPRDPEWSPPPALAAFLARPGPVVSIGFGSMASRDAGATAALLRGAARDAGVRAVLLADWGGLVAPPDGDDLFVADALPHDWLFPQMRAIVHHGGAGTTGAGLLAGVPSIVVPFAVDQPFWGGRVAALGVGPAPIPRQRLTRERLAAALRRTVTDEAMRERAAALGTRLRAEDGVAVAVAQFARLATARRGTAP